MKRKMRKMSKSFSACALAVSLSVSSVSPVQLVHATENVKIDYDFVNDTQAGYAQGTLSVSSNKAGTYHLYWADDTKALDGYYEINSKLKDELTSRLGGKKFEGRGFIVKAGQKASFTFDAHTAIPAGATKVIAVTDTNKTNVSDAVAVFDIPKDKQLKSESGDLLYRFNSYSDMHLSSGSWWSKSKKRCDRALEFAKEKKVDFINITGDITTSPNESEWKLFRDKVKAASFKGDIWECTGNHELKDAAGKKWFIDYALKTDSDYSVAKDSTYNKDKAYYYKVEEGSGDVFIYLALENSDPTSGNVFSQEQMEWFESVIKKYYESGVNIFVSEHAPYQEWSIGEFKYGKKLYKAHLQNKGTTKTFINILSKYKKLIWMNGHTHQDLCMATNYSNENGNACNMIHNPGCGGTTYGYNKSAADKISNASKQQYHSPEQAVQGKEDGAGYHSQGYYVETYENEVVYHGYDVDNKMIYPEYCYIMEGARHTDPTPTPTTKPLVTMTPLVTTAPVVTTAPTSTPIAETTAVYFDNSKAKWSKVYAYIWGKNKVTTELPATKVGNNIYKVEVPKGYPNIIFKNTSKTWALQTKDLLVPTSANNCYKAYKGNRAGGSWYAYQEQGTEMPNTSLAEASTTTLEGIVAPMQTPVLTN